MNVDKLGNIFRWLLVAIFFIVIFIPSLRMITGEKAMFSVAEKRSLASFPPFPKSFNQLRVYFSDIDQYLNDHFGYREWLVYRYQREVGKRFADASNVTQVLKGTNNWYFFTGHAMLENFTGRNLRSDKDLESWIQSFQEKRSWLESRGIRYLLVVPPNKVSIYSKFVGEPWLSNQGMSRIEQIKNTLTDNDQSALVDLAPMLRKENHQDTLYFRSDTHWTSHGAYLGYLGIAEKIESLFPGVRFKKDFALTPAITRKCEKKKGNCGDLTNILLDYDSFSESYRDVENFAQCAERIPLDYPLSNLQSGDKDYHFKTTCSSGTLKAVVFRDSFFTALLPYFSENFSEAIYLWKDYDQKNVAELLATFRPDIVIEEKLERRL